jgi:hypothetical protein
MAVQTQLMQRMAEAMEHRVNVGNRASPQDEDLTRKIERFIRLKAPTFSYSDDPLDTDDWLRVIETKLDLTVCSDEECVAITAHQLEDIAKLGGTTTPPPIRTQRSSPGWSSARRSASSIC